MDSNESILLDGAYVTAIGMLTVFLILVLIFISIKLVVFLASIKKDLNDTTENNEIIRIPEQKVNISESQVAAIAVAYLLQGQNQNIDHFDTNQPVIKNSSNWWSNGNQRSLNQPTTKY